VKSSSLKNRLLIVFAVIFFAVVAGTLINLQLMTILQKEMQSIFQIDLKVQQKTEQLRHNIEIIQHQVLQATLNKNKEYLITSLKEDSHITELLDEIKAIDTTSDFNQSFDRIKQGYQQFIETALAINMQHNRLLRTNLQQPDQLRITFEKLNQSLDHMVNQAREHLNQRADSIQLQSEVSILIHWVLTMSILSVLIAAMLLLERKLTRPVATLSAILKQITQTPQGLNKRMPTGLKHEIGTICIDVNHMLDNLQKTTVSHDHLETLINQRTTELTQEIAERKQAEEQLRLAATVFETTSEGIMVTDIKNRLKAVNSAFCRMTGYSEDEILGQDPQLLRSNRHDAIFYEKLWAALKARGHWAGEVWNKRKNGEVFPTWLSIATVQTGEHNESVQYVAILRDITEQKQDEEQILLQATYDNLTGLPNRTLFLERLSDALATIRRQRGILALLFIDLDNFKSVNDTLGHDKGDLLLQQAAHRLKTCIREVDTVARFGGDEFTVILQMIGSANSAAQVAEKIIHTFAAPFLLDGNEAYIGASIGISLSPHDSTDPAVLLRNADIAMYQAKAVGRNQYYFFTEEINANAQARMTMELDLRRAIERDEFSICYQPIIDLSSGRISSLEALIRWHHPEHGWITPDNFIPLAEETGLINPIGEWVLKTACQQGQQWIKEGMSPLIISVNLSSRQMMTGRMIDTLERILDETKYPTKFLVLEITESLLLEDTATTTQQLHKLKEMGIKLSIDDFGTGHSSLSYLKRFPVDTIKIDKSFIQDMAKLPEDASLVQAIIAMSHSLGLSTIAEGVEDQDQLTLIRALKCDFVQGYYFSKPLQPHELAGFFNREFLTDSPIQATQSLTDNTLLQH